jgi:predicted dehydrogenase
LITTDYDRWPQTGMEVIPYIRLYRVMRARILGEPVAAHPVAATFADGVAMQELLAAIRLASDEGRTVAVPPV